MFIASIFIIAQKCKQLKCLSANEWINKMWYIHTVEYYSEKKNRVLILDTTWIKFENIMLSVKSQSQKATYCLVPFTWNVQNKQNHRDRK